jgi:hypothetical protein
MNSWTFKGIIAESSSKDVNGSRQWRIKIKEDSDSKKAATINVSLWAESIPDDGSLVVVCGFFSGFEWNGKTCMSMDAVAIYDKSQERRRVANHAPPPRPAPPPARPPEARPYSVPESDVPGADKRDDTIPF